MNKTCLKCGIEFETNRTRKVYCSEVCRMRAEQERYRERKKAAKPSKKYVCQECGNEFEKNNRGLQPKYCSHKCSSNFKARRARENKVEVLTDTLCPTCSKPLTQHQVNTGVTYCGHDCYAATRRTLIGTTRICVVCSKEFEPGYKDQQCCGDECAKKKTVARLRELAPKHLYTCQHCGKEYRAKKADRNQYCSRECFWEYRRDHPAAQRGIQPVFVYVCSRCGVHTSRGGNCESCERLQAKVWAYIEGLCEHLSKEIICTCKECKKKFEPEYGDKRREFCSDKCLKKNSGRKGKATRRARIAGSAMIEVIDPLAVLSRDKWKCHMCGRSTPRRLRGTYEDNAPELDHIIPLAQGGSHTWDNVACACRECNNKKGSQIIGQQMLPVFASVGI